jgi:regulator of sigma E protease
MEIIIYLLVALGALSVLVFFHELGHFLAARFFGVTVERFSIGFGKVLAKKRCCDTEWAFSMIPLGGYVKMKGQDDTDPALRNREPDSYGAKAPWQRIIILLAGPFANLVLAFFTYLVIALAGAPLVAARDYIAPVVGKVAPGTPAAKADMRPGDRIVSINGRPVRYWYEIGRAIQKSPEPVKITIERNGNESTLSLLTKKVSGTNEFEEKVERRIIGISPEVNRETIIRFTPGEALFYAWNETVKASLLIATGVKKMTTGEVGADKVGGAITIFDIIMKFAKEGILYLLFIMALISVNLGVLNILPIPALDGGHILFNIYEIVARREPSETVYYRLTVMGWIILFAIMFLGIYNDINRIWGGAHG